MKKEEIINNSTGGGIGFIGTLAILFIALKLIGIIDWSWWWILAPIWIPFVIVLLALIIVGIISIFN